jgi:hypothetical protein
MTKRKSKNAKSTNNKTQNVYQDNTVSTTIINDNSLLNVKKVEILPQTYVEDTFDITNNLTNNHIIIENNVKENKKKYITKEQLLVDPQFKNKVERTIKNIIFNKSFNTLLDLSTFSSSNRMHYLDEFTDDVDVMFEQIVFYFKKRLRSISLTYKDYQTIDSYFESLATIYQRFKNHDTLDKADLKDELDKLIKMENFIKYHIF